MRPAPRLVCRCILAAALIGGFGAATPAEAWLRRPDPSAMEPPCPRAADAMEAACRAAPQAGDAAAPRSSAGQPRAPAVAAAPLPPARGPAGR